MYLSKLKKKRTNIDSLILSVKKNVFIIFRRFANEQIKISNSFVRTYSEKVWNAYESMQEK